MEAHYVNKISNEAKLLDETEEKLIGMSCRIMNGVYRNRQKSYHY